MKKFKENSLIFEAVYETASDLHACGVINDERMREYENDCLETVPVNLDKDVLDYLNQKCNFDAEKMRILINDWLRKDIEIARSVSS